MCRPGLRSTCQPNQTFCCLKRLWRSDPDAQFAYLRDWQQQLYEAGYLGMAWPQAYGGGGAPQVLQDIVNAELARVRAPFVPNTIGLNWGGTADLGHWF